MIGPVVGWAQGHWLLLGCLLLALRPAAGQSPGSGGGFFADFPTTPPASYVLDEADLFRHDTASLRRISERLAGFDTRHRMPIYLVVYAGLIGTTAAQRAVDLHKAWLGERYGFVLVFDSDSGDLGLGRPFEPDRAVANEAARAAATGRIPSYELLEIMLRVNERMESAADRVQHLDRMTNGIVNEFEACLERLEAPASRAERLRFGLIVVGVIAGIALVALVATRWWSQAEAHAGRAYRFPSVLVGQRLGAPYGGGRVSSRQFRETGRGRGPEGATSGGGTSAGGGG
jgi:uncharacterized membrane protein YgcG